MNGLMSLPNAAREWAGWGLTLATYAGASAALLAGAVLIINGFLRRSISARQMGWLWGLVLLRLIIPVAPPSSFSLGNAWLSAQAMVAERGQARENAAPDRITAIDLPEPDAADAVSESVASAPIESPPVEAAAIEISWSIAAQLLRLLSAIWLVGGAGFLLWTALLHSQFCRRLKRGATSADPRECRLWEECCREVGMRRWVPLLLFDGVGQPAVFGLFRPRLLLPASATKLHDRELRMVMLHELAHVRRWHLAANWVLVVIGAIHWWNPIYWLAAARFRNLREQSCDAFAIRRIEGRSIRDYGELLLKLAETRPSRASWNVMVPASILGFFASYLRKRAIANRLKALRLAGRSRSRWHAAAVALMVGLIALCGLTDARTQEPTPDHSSNSLPYGGSRGDGSSALPEGTPAPSVSRTYDIKKALERVAASEKIEDARRDIYLTIVYLLQAGTGRIETLTDEWAKRHFSLDGTRLTVNAPLHVHAQIARSLSAWEESGLGQTAIQTCFLTDEHDLASQTGVSWQYLEAPSAGGEDPLPDSTRSGTAAVRARTWVDDYVPVAVSALDEQQSSKLLHTAQNSASAKVLYCPKVTVFNGQLASLSIGTHRPFVVGVGHDGVHGERPETAVIDEGTKVALRIIQSRDGKTVRLEGRVDLSEIGDVRTTSALLHGKPVTIQTPRVTRRRIDISSEIPDGHSLLIGYIPAYEQKKFLYLMITVRSIEPGGEIPSPPPKAGRVSR